MLADRPDLLPDTIPPRNPVASAVETAISSLGSPRFLPASRLQSNTRGESSNKQNEEDSTPKG